MKTTPKIIAPLLKNIPDDWEIKEMWEVTTLLTNGFVGTATSHYVENGDGITYIQGYNVIEGGFNLKGIKKVSKEFHEKNKKSCLKEGDLLTIQTGDVGITTIVPKSLEGSNCHALVISRFMPKIIDSRFYFQFFNSILGRRILKKIETGSTMKHLNVGDMKYLQIPIPPLPEQVEISNILSTWDKAIENTQALLEQKEKRKKWLMRMLLTGKKRLKGFEKEKWLKGKFSDFVDLLHGHQFRKEDFVPAGIPVIKIGNVIGYELDLTDLTYVAESRENEFSDVLLKNGDLLMSLTGNIGRVIEIRNFRGKAFQNYRVGKFVSYDEKVLSREYLKFLLGSESLLNQFLNMANQSAQANFGKQDMNKLNVTFSKSLEEQNAIASFLEHIEGEVKLLQLKLGEIKKQKQGLMQVLLTGKKRLKIKK